MWKREEALSQIKQVEVFDLANVNTDIVNQEMQRLSYLRTMGDKDVSIASIPGRIIQRYVDNLKHLATSAISLVESLTGKKSDIASISGAVDPYGIRKTLVLLTKPNKVVSISSFNGAIGWSYYSKQPIIKVFVEQSAGSNFVHEILVVTQTSVIYLDPITGNVLHKDDYQKSVSHGAHDFMLVEGKLISGSSESHQVVLAVPSKGDSG